jgi:hypothetical protein
MADFSRMIATFWILHEIESDMTLTRSIITSQYDSVCSLGNIRIWSLGCICVTSWWG